MLITTKLFRKFRRHRKVIAFAVVILAVAFVIVVILPTELSPDLYFIHWGPLEDISCHYMESEDALPSAESPTFSPPSRSIFFHETSCNGGLSTRQACAVESAARAHPNWKIFVLFSAPVINLTLNSGSLGLMKKFTNVEFARIHITNYAKGTPLESLVSGGALHRTRWRIAHTSDILRYLSLYKWGGVYLDLDVVVARSLGSLARNWAARESATNLAAGALAFSKDNVGRKIAKAALEDINSSYRGDVWGHNGPDVMKRVLQKLCSTMNASAMSAATCNGFEVYGPQFFYPIPWQRSNLYFEKGQLYKPKAYVYHVWNRFSQKYKVIKDCPYARLAKRYCPTTFNYFGDEFGS